MLVEEKVDVITTGAGSPEKYVADWKAVGTKVIPVVSGVALAKRMERMGVDALIAEGGESGGHVGEMTIQILRVIFGTTRMYHSSCACPIWRT